jgi:hypothetical protein
MASTVTLVKGVAAGAFAFATNVANDDTVVIGDITYTFKTTPNAVYTVDVGADLDTSIGNLVAAINASGTAGLTTYYTGTLANPYVTAAADLANDEIDLTARYAGDWINALRLDSTHPGANEITAASTCFSGVSGGTDGSGNLASHLLSVLELCQVNSDVQVELKKVTEAAD